MKKLVLFLLLLPVTTVFAGEYIWFDEPREIVYEKSFKVFQAIHEHAGLARGKENVYLVMVYGEACYDGKIINVPRKFVARVVGTYRYETKDGIVKTVAIIQIQKRTKNDKITLKKRR